MTAMRINYDVDEPEIGVGELIKTQKSSSSTRREYLRMRAERELREKQENLMSPISEETENQDNDIPCSIPDADTALRAQESEPEITSFPFADAVDGPAGKKDNKHLEASGHPGHRHGAKLCMVSAVLHMKALAQRKPKSIVELKKNPLTTKQEQNLNKTVSDDDSDSEPEEELAYLKNCRYLRGVNEDKELSIDEIFG